MSMIESQNDDRIKNNGARHQYRQLSDQEKQDMVKIKDMGADFILKLHEIGKTDPSSDRQASRDLSLAMTHIEDAVMRAVRHITK